MTKTKMSTVAIVTLSVLLAAALAATIVLAAFAFSKSASTTITFGKGVSVTVTGITDNAWDTYLVSPAGAINNNTNTGGTTDLTQGIALSNITIANPNSTAIVVAVGYKIENESEAVTAPTLYATTTDKTGEANNTTAMNGDGAFAATSTSGTTAIVDKDTARQWRVFKLAANATALNVINYINTNYGNEVESDKGFKATFYIAAVADDDDAATNLQKLVTTAGYVTAEA